MCPVIHLVHQTLMLAIHLVDRDHAIIAVGDALELEPVKVAVIATASARVWR